ncbi:uncharacterized protein EV420DRAFT_1501269 [Desarmillaria tabescens]|uniref:Uncharacterized protein n=1 Tax=Armillaria tabescens TaxID=1929756 RepID=A0AA39NLD0_ARMTA|nr:uncharacterized protein EV420DRAFT_1501269 [Desarmillaria tabescens]KAK0467782.1 hypothetical protein EV420DRAFT_1501269 [Desarmillaria tabescens]
MAITISSRLMISMSTNNYSLAIPEAKRQTLIYVLASLSAYFLVSVVLAVIIAKWKKAPTKTVRLVVQARPVPNRNLSAQELLPASRLAIPRRHSFYGSLKSGRVRFSIVSKTPTRPPRAQMRRDSSNQDLSCQCPANCLGCLAQNIDRTISNESFDVAKRKDTLVRFSLQNSLVK